MAIKVWRPKNPEFYECCCIIGKDYCGGPGDFMITGFGGEEKLFGDEEKVLCGKHLVRLIQVCQQALKKEAKEAGDGK